MKLAIVIPTYKKKDGSTKEQLKRALLSVKNQKFTDYKIYLIGDDYSDYEELKEISNIIDPDKLFLKNLEVAVERVKYTGLQLWVCGGVNASNIGIKKALEDGYRYICHLDQDDWFFPNHLELISDVIERKSPHFITTKCGNWPNIDSEELEIEYRPLPSKIFKVTTCVDYSYYKLKFRNMVEEFNKTYASDADMWVRINKHMIDNNEYGILINTKTCGRGPGKSVLNE
jgi:hypothetical protein